ncbi:hypothetical protein CQ393_08925 [Stenotrophomonas sp. MYb238]|uniref:hypothetical protein n=1 Tax=Stenotrophomonas sp. MYb238 TaxID=2040281 RepID=UPI00129261AB|nr:hypothetical protein [Stenotrophomonas sp. MYb238]MQP76014.1 hypothetical protein [Stenotrophomonas sp. MYb238]
MYRCLLIVLSLGAAAMLPVDAAAAGKSGDAPPTCVTLSGQHKAARVGTDGMVIADGDNHLRLDFGHYCDAMMKNSSVVLATDGRENVVCTQGSVLTSRAGSCPVRAMYPIDEAEYQRRARRRN